jgi:arylsulfatase A-like enzyme
MRRLTDRDHDGYSARFGGGDCDDTRADVNPDASDLPGNGRDEDCSGADARPELAARARSGPGPTGDAHALALASVLPGLNVVLLTVDTLRYDLGYAGNPRRVSPELDRLAAEGVVFERAYSLASYTAKSLPPMLIGRYSSETHRGWSHFNRFEKSDPFLAERLTAAGIHTTSVQGHWYFFQNYGMERGFAVIDSSAAPRAAQAAEGDRSVTSEHVSDAVIAQLGQRAAAKQPFFLWAHYTDPHAEYVAHEGFDFGAGSRSAYDSEVAFVDHHLGRVLAALREGPLWANTAIIVTSDHGEAFSEHGMIRHGFELWEELVRVPLLVRVPNAAAHHVVPRRSAIDIVPTILELFRQPLPAAGGGDFLSGVSLLPELFLPAGYTPSERPVFVDMAEGPYNAERRALLEGDSKLVMSAGRPLGLYDLGKDPAEKRDLSADKRLLEPAVERFRSFRRTLREVSVRPQR